MDDRESVQGFPGGGVRRARLAHRAADGAWLPAGVVVLGLLAGGPPVAVAAAAGAAIALVWAFAPAFGPGPAFLIAIAALLPSRAGGLALERSRSLTLRVPGADGGVVPAGAGDPRPAG